MMKTAEDLLQFIDDRYSRIILHPTQFASTAVGLESIVSLLEEIRAFVLERPDESFKFVEFVASRGYGVTGICHEPGVAVTLTEDVRQQIVTVAGVLSQFLEAEGRLPRREPPKGQA
jgi:hypothetical protein